MKISRKQTKQLQGLAILFMLGLHLFNRGDFLEVYDAHVNIMGKPLILYISYIFDACLPIYLFCSGYGAGYNFEHGCNRLADRIKRLKKFILKYWFVMVVTCVVGYLLGMKDLYPGTAEKFVQNIFLLKNSYVGALWFVQTYVLLTLCSKWIFSVVRNNFWKITMLGSLLLYIFAFVIEYRILPMVYYEWLNSTLYALMLLMRSQFMYTVGMVIAVQEQKKLEDFCGILKKNRIMVAVIVVLVILGRGIFAHMIFAPFSAMVVIMMYISTGKKPISTILDYFGKHSMNIWMVHMQLYMLFAEKYIFWTRNPFLVYGTLLLSSLALSYMMDLIFAVCKMGCLMKRNI